MIKPQHSNIQFHKKLFMPLHLISAVTDHLKFYYGDKTSSDGKSNQCEKDQRTLFSARELTLKNRSHKHDVERGVGLG